MGLGWVRIGVRCVCINALPRAGYPTKMNIVSGETYTISSIGIHSITGEVAIKLLEAPDRGGLDEGYSIYRFRPLITLEDDISMFTALTNMSPIERLDRMKEMMDQ